MRRHLDQYFTPKWATHVLLQHQKIVGNIVEPCSGGGDIADPLRAVGNVSTNDIDHSLTADTYEDAATEGFWESMAAPDWVVSNPPFSCCHPIIVGAFSRATQGVAMLLRLSYLEPCNNRAEFLATFPPSLIVLPRISFTGDGKTDNVTCAWFVWDFSRQDTFTKVITKKEVAGLMAVSESDTPDPATIQVEAGL